MHIAASLAVIAMLALLVVPAQAAPGTEGSVFNYQQCANDKPLTPPAAVITDCVPQGWINGILNAQNSQYAEDQVTAQRLFLDLPPGGSLNDRSLVLRYLIRKANNHAYDSLATWDHTQTTADPCQGFNPPTTTSCNQLIAAGAKTKPIPPDPLVVEPVGSGISPVTSDHQLAGQQFEMYGLGANGGIDTATYLGTTNDGQDQYQSIRITYHLDPTLGTNGNITSQKRVILLFGGHLAAGGGARSWGAGFGSSNINGGPYHIKLDFVDDAAIGNRDNQITSGAILPLQTSVVTELHETDINGDDLSPTPNNGSAISATLPAGGGTVYVVDYATVTPSDATGSVAFRYYPSLTACEADTTGTGGTGAGVDTTLDQGTATSNITSFTSAGTSYWRAFFTGTDISTNSLSPCDEILTITQDTSTSTLLHETNSTGTDVTPANNGLTITVSPGAYVTDVATVLPSSAIGTVTFRYYGSSTACEADTTGTGGTGAGSDTVDQGTATSSTIQFNDVGTFYWRAFFDGTDPNNDSVSPCNETVTVEKASPTLATAPSLIPQDSATLDGILTGGTGGQLTFTLYGPDATGNSDCTGPVLFSEVVLNVTADGTYTTTNSGDPSDNDGFSLTSDSDTGIYSWVVDYNGDQVNNGTTAACGVETFDFQGITDTPVVP